MDDNAQAPRQTPFSLAYLFLFITVLAILLPFWLALLETYSAGFANQEVLKLQILFFHIACVNAMGLSGTIVRLQWQFRSQRVRWQPGHWLLLQLAIMAVFTIATNVSDAIHGTTVFDDSVEGRAWRDIATNSQHLLGIVIFLAVSILSAIPWRWRVMFILLCIRVAIEFLPAFTNSWRLDAGMVTFVSEWTIWGTLMGVACVSVWDLIKQQNRDWLHWVGVAAWLFQLVPTFVVLLF